MQLSGHGITAELPSGWEGRISRRIADATQAVPGAIEGLATAAVAVAEETFPVAHLANFALPSDRGDFGSGAVNVMGPDNVLLCLLEYGPECVNTPLFAPTGLPRHLNPGGFGANQLQRAIKGQAGQQLFFTEANRAFCLFVVLGAQRKASTLVPLADDVLSSLQIDPRSS
jgi:hypothetical protein